MHPRSLLEQELKSTGEGKVFAALRDGLSEEWEVFHSASVVFRDHAAGAQDDESDFVLSHPGKGIVSLEVKGGGIECRYGEWYRLARGGGRERMRDPFTQAIDHRYELKRKLETVPEWGGREVFIVHALAFPDISVHGLVLAPDAPDGLLLDRSDLADVESGIERVLAYHRGSRDRRGPPGVDGAAIVRETLAPRVRIEVPMATEFLEEEEQLVLLTHEQSALLNRFGRERRMVVTGCAGSGKTMLAVERAKRLAAKGEDVLFVCFNRALLEHLRRSESQARISFFTFHGLCTHLAGRAGVELSSYPKGEAPPEFFREELPHALLEATDKLGGLYDALIVDEAQDLHGDWLEALTTTLRDEEESSAWLFTDDNQRVYEAILDVPREYRPFDLTVNCRNTQAIHREVMKLYEGDVVPEVKGPPGRDIELHPTDDPGRTVKGVLARLCGQEEIPPQDVVVLSSHGLAKSEVARGGGGSYSFVPERGKLGKHVHFSSIRGFKGLEAPVVVLCELEDLDEESRDHQLYVALSRARNHCVVVAPKS
jgi:hypothetical protein